MIYLVVICSFGNKTAKDIYNGENSRFSRKLPNAIQKIAFRKLDQLNAAINLSDLRIPPSNRIENLKGDLKGSHSIRINNQWRVVFEWTKAGPINVKILDYHK
jgi:toxin HigB-1